MFSIASEDRSLREALELSAEAQAGWKARLDLVAGCLRDNLNNNKKHEVTAPQSPTCGGIGLVLELREGV
jgi:hypothetical protein